MNIRSNFSSLYREITGQFVRLFGILFLLSLAACSDLDVKPAGGNYPINLSVEAKSTFIQLEWNQTPVSTFGEYIILRSSSPIPDSPVPETTVSTIIVDRIDENNIHTFRDFTFPLEEVLYYKVYADIGDRFLSSPSVMVTTDFDRIPFRADALFFDKKEKRVLGFDQFNDIFFEYDYINGEVIGSQFISMGFPVIRTGEYLGQKEVYLYDNGGTVYILDRNTLEVKKQFHVNLYSIVDFYYNNGLFYATYRSNAPGFGVFDRNGLIKSTSAVVTGNDHKLLLIPGSEETEVIDVGLQKIARYGISQSGTTSLISSISLSNQSAQSLPRFNADSTLFVSSNLGQIFNRQLNLVHKVQANGKFFNNFIYTEDNAYLVGTVSEFDVNVTRNRILFYGTEDYLLKKEHGMPFQPNMVFTDGDKIYFTGIVAISGQVITAIVHINIAD